MIQVPFNKSSMEILIGKPIVPNQCGPLGQNNPVKLNDCSIHSKKNANCCLLTTFEDKFIEDQDGEQFFQRLSETACIVLEKSDSKTITKVRKGFRDALDIPDLTLECCTGCIKFVYSMILIGLLVL